jgi:hypothetical protein
MYRLPPGEYDEETSIGWLTQLAGFDDLEELEGLFRLSDEDYWERVRPIVTSESTASRRTSAAPLAVEV